VDQAHRFIFDHRTIPLFSIIREIIIKPSRFPPDIMHLNTSACHPFHFGSTKIRIVPQPAPIGTALLSIHTGDDTILDQDMRTPKPM
jgi:hypothetical protein